MFTGRHQHHIKDSGRCQPQSKDQGYLLEHVMCLLFELSFCLAKAALPLCLPCAGFSFQFQLYSLLQIAWRIQFDKPQADSLIEAGSSYSASLFLSLPLASGELLPREQHNTSCHLTLQSTMPASSLCYSHLWCNTAPKGMFGFCSIFSLDGWRAD